MQRKALLHQKYHRVRSIRKDILGLVFSSRINTCASTTRITASGNAGRRSHGILGDFEMFYKFLQ